MGKIQYCELDTPKNNFNYECTKIKKQDWDESNPFDGPCWCCPHLHQTTIEEYNLYKKTILNNYRKE